MVALQLGSRRESIRKVEEGHEREDGGQEGLKRDEAGRSQQWRLLRERRIGGE